MSGGPGRAAAGSIFRSSSPAALPAAQPIAVTDKPANHWAPAIAADGKGNVYVAWDSYENGNYDVFLRRFHNGEAGTGHSRRHAQGLRGPAQPGRRSAGPRVDRLRDGRAELGQGLRPRGSQIGAACQSGSCHERPRPDRMRRMAGDGVGIPLYQDRRVVVKCYADGRLQQPAANPAAELDDVAAAQEFCPADDGRRRAALALVPPSSAARRHAARPGPNMRCRSTARPGASRGCWPIRTAFWTTGRPCAPFGRDGVMAVYSSDWRLRARTTLVAAGRLPLKADLYATHPPRRRSDWSPRNWSTPWPARRTSSRSIPTSRKTSSGCGNTAWSAAARPIILARGEFHRHTEYTAHRDGDGSLEDMWRYAQDAADMDWLGNGDHDNGFGHQYPWWITQKTMDIYHNPPWFIAPYTYERSVRVAQRAPQRDLHPARHSHLAPRRHERRREVGHAPTPRCSTPT